MKEQHLNPPGIEDDGEVTQEEREDREAQATERRLDTWKDRKLYGEEC